MAELTGTAIALAFRDHGATERLFAKCAGDAMLEFGEYDPERHRYAAREIARIAARLAAARTAEAIADAQRLLDRMKGAGASEETPAPVVS
jgi:predicted TIM-barrel fold metal-dependent hydrolase